MSSDCSRSNWAETVGFYLTGVWRLEKGDINGSCCGRTDFESCHGRRNGMQSLIEFEY